MDKVNAETYSRRFFDDQMVDAAQSAKVVVPLVLDIVPAGSVVDVGCGTGVWLKEFVDRGVARAVGLDGEYVARDQFVSKDATFIGHDLEKPLPPMGAFDLAVSLEVAEHLTPSRADSFVAELCALSDVVLFSAAIPFQGGDNHINEQWQSFWAGKFAANGFSPFDLIRSRIWQEPNVCFWYKQNILFYVRRGSAAARRFEERSSRDAGFLDIVHPSLYEAKMNRMYSGSLYRRVSNPFRPKIARSLTALKNRTKTAATRPRETLDS